MVIFTGRVLSECLWILSDDSPRPVDKGAQGVRTDLNKLFVDRKGLEGEGIPLIAHLVCVPRGVAEQTQPLVSRGLPYMDCALLAAHMPG